MKIPIPFLRAACVALQASVFAILLTACADEPRATVYFDIKNSADATSITLTAQVNHYYGTLGEKGFLFGQAPGLTLDNSEKIVSGTSQDPRFFIMKFSLEPTTTYYGRPFAVVNGKMFIGDEFAVTTEADDAP